MKASVYVCLLSCLWFVSLEAGAQERTRLRPGQVESTEAALPELSVRAKAKNEEQTQNLAGTPWLREMYRLVNLKEEANAPLYYPVEPIGDRMNLFTLIFKLFSDNKLEVYEYLDGKEIFTEAYKVAYNKETLNRFSIYFTEQKAGAATRLVVEESDIPGVEVLSYLVKEAWYYNASNSTVDVKLLAICPMLVREGDFGEMTRTPMFWVPYENIRPYISQRAVMTSTLNNAATYTMDDYFRKRMFKGEIIKTTNLLNHTLAQQVGDNPEALKLAQDSIELQLQSFEKSLWMKQTTENDSTAQVSKAKATKKTGKSARSTGSKTKQAKAEKPKKAKAEKSSSTTTRSVRRTR